MLLPLAQIRRENDLQARDQSHWTRDGAERTALDPAHVAALVEVLRSGRTFSTRPIVYQDEAGYWLADGWHRLAAYEVVGQTEIEVEIREGGRRGAFRHALGANAEHGKPRTQKDKRRAVDLALGDAELGNLSNREIGDITGTSHTFVAGRRELRAAGEAMRQAAPRSRALGLAKARAALVCALNGAESVGVETFDLPGRPGQEVALWYDGIDELSREEIDEAIQALGDAHRAKTVPLYRQPPPRPDPLPGQQLLTGGEVPAVAPASERRAESRALGARIGRCIAALRAMDPHDLVHLGGDVGLVEAGILLGSATSASWAEIELATLEAALFPTVTPDRDDGPGSLVALESTCPDPSPPAASPASPSAERAQEAPPATADDCADSATAGAGQIFNEPGPTSPPSASPAASGDAATTCPTSAAAASSSSTMRSPAETTSTTAETGAKTATMEEPSRTATDPAGTTSTACAETTERPESWQAAITAALGLPAEEPLALVLRSLALLQSQRDRYSAVLTEYATAEPMVCVGCKGRTSRMEHGEMTSYALCADCAIQARDEMIAHLRADDGSEPDPSSDEGAMVAEALDRWRSTVCLALGLPEMGSLEQVENALAVLKTSAAVDVVGMQHRLDAAVGRERQALARAEAAEREAAQLRIRADQVAVLEADLVKAHERADQAEADRRWAIESSTQAVGESVKFAQQQIDVLTAERDAAQARSESFRRTLAGTANDLALALGVADQGLAWAELVALVRSRAANLEREVKRLTAHLEIADEQIEAVRKMEQASYQQLEARRLEEIERLRAQVCALAEDRDRAVKLALDCAPEAEVPAGWPEGWTADPSVGGHTHAAWQGPRRADGHRGPSAVIYTATGGGFEMAMELVDEDRAEDAAELLRRMAWGLAGRPLPEPALTAEEAAQVLAESAARMSQIRARRDDWGEPATLPPDPMAIYRPWKGSADELAAQLNALGPADLEQVRLGFTVAPGARLVERLTVAIRRGGR